MYEDGAYALENPTWHREDAEHKARIIGALVAEAGVPAGSVVDVGCGTGHVLAALDLGDSWGPFEGWDIAEDAIQRAPDSERCSYVVGDALASGQRWQLAMAIDVLEHTRDDAAFLAGLSQLAPFIVLRVPLDLSAWDAVRPARLVRARERWGHVQLYNRPLLHRLLSECGLEVRAERYDRFRSEARGLGRVSDAVRNLGVRVAPHMGVRLFGGHSMVVVASRMSG